MKNAVFSIAYCPPISWWKSAFKFDTIYIEKHESLQRRTYRNRCEILGANGRFSLSIPIKKNDGEHSIGQVEINYAEDWRHTHWRAIRSAYGGTPFFESISFELEQVYQQRFTLLFDFNLALIFFIKKCMQAEFKISFTKKWEKSVENDYRKNFGKVEFSPLKYPQHFEHPKFEENLSILDLICNEGPAARGWLLEKV